MDTAELVLEYIKVFIWPTTVLVVALLFRTAIRGLLGRMTKAEAFGTTAEFALVEKVVEDIALTSDEKVERIGELMDQAEARKRSQVAQLYNRFVFGDDDDPNSRRI